MLLLLFARRDRSWTADTVASELRVHQKSAGVRLAQLERLGFLAQSNGAYRYAAPPNLERMVQMLAREYTVRRASVIELVFSRPVTAQTFADAFRLWSDDDDHS